jgi:hypothetical protein
MVMALMYNAEAYHTRGSVRHVVGWTQMNRADVFSQITINDYWTSILENWADSIKEYNKECVAKQALITVCLPKMSKYFWRMLDAMFAAYGKLKPTLQTGIVMWFDCYIAPKQTTEHHTIPYHTIPYHTIPYHTIPYHTIPYHTTTIKLTLFILDSSISSKLFFLEVQ